MLLHTLLLAFAQRVGLPDISQLPPGAGLGLIFTAGLLTSFHCAAMCGGIALAQTAAPGTRQGLLARLKPSFPYHAGRILSYSAIGALAGGLGQVIRLPGVFKGAIPVLGGLFMIIMGINLLGVWRFLRKLNLRMPGFAARRLLSGISRPGPLAVGLLSGLMPCGPLQIMQLYALASGSAWHGFASLLVFSLGTAPMLLLFSSIHAVTGKSFTNAVTRFSAVIVIVLGAAMLARGLALSGIAAAPSAAAWNTAGIAVIAQDSKVQTVRTVLDPDSRDSYPPIVVQKGIPVQWIFSAEKEALDTCNESLVLPAFHVEQRLVPGDNIIRFTPGEAGEFVYTCWMGMIKSRIQVVDDLAAYRAGSAVSPRPPAAAAASPSAPPDAISAAVPAGTQSPSPEASLLPLASPGNGQSAAEPLPPSPAGPKASAVTPAPAAEAPAAAPPASPAAVPFLPPSGDPGPPVQTVVTTVSPNGYTPVTVQKGIPVKWIIRAKAEDLNECNNALTAPAFGLEAKLEAGDTILEFTPSEAGEFTFSCWMEMIKSTITVVEQGG
ncbi:sulfite exporter TauE/SafE family protein [Paenibacillus sp. YN15]|uniref:urease accessory protein UreH domain-containing protein n=1 Tax=Paenibacillus sp. YN15 TaxID=1742774 RepID=UPI000DCCD303|nr:sulfite exporter TauE/SafE family protein [Paenibacillus sp. YN15]RAV04166.1 hypothetical protein DQG13_06730 [Paenibacillus sp. YN15]